MFFILFLSSRFYVSDLLFNMAVYGIGSLKEREVRKQETHLVSCKVMPPSGPPTSVCWLTLLLLLSIRQVAGAPHLQHAFCKTCLIVNGPQCQDTAM